MVMNKEKLKTKRMLLQPMSNEEIETLIKHTDSEELKRAYCEMLEGCKKDSQNRVWYAPWKMKLKKTGEMIGDLCFKGPEKNHSVEIGYGVLPEQEGPRFVLESPMTDW